MREINLTQGKCALVDDEDFESVDAFKWYFNSGYAVRGTKPRIGMARSILGETGRNVVVDHINGDTLDNRKTNLRRTTQSKNCINRGKRKSKTSSPYKGVSYVKKHANWMAYICRDNRQHYLGVFKTEVAAALAYNEASTHLHGEFGRLNVIPEAIP